MTEVWFDKGVILNSHFKIVLSNFKLLLRAHLPKNGNEMKVRLKVGQVRLG
jgi:hypothetical protein